MRFLSEEKIEAGPDFDWDTFLKEARQERVSPLLYKRICALDTQNILVPARIQQSLKNDYYTQLINNAEILRQFEEIGCSFIQEKIPFILLKGLALAGPVYQDLGLRSSQDMDILINDSDLLRANQVLGSFGYQAPFPLRDSRQFKTNRYRNALLYINRNKNKLPVHIFWHLLNLLPYHKKVNLDMQKVWSQAQKSQVGNLEVYTLDFNHQIIYLSMHAMSHGFFPLILLVDIKELLSKQEGRIDWDELLAKAHSTGLSKHLYYGLSAAVNLTGARVPLWVLEKLKPKKISVFEREFMDSVFKRKYFNGQEFFAYLGMNETVSDRISFLAAAFFPAREELALIRQKDVLEVNPLDYFSRFFFGLKCALKPFPRNNLSK